MANLLTFSVKTTQFARALDIAEITIYLLKDDPLKKV
jgi:hypothetical protein